MMAATIPLLGRHTSIHVCLPQKGFCPMMLPGGLYLPTIKTEPSAAFA